MNFSMVFLGDEIDLASPVLNQYLYTHKDTHICFENRSITSFGNPFVPNIQIEFCLLILDIILE